MKTGGEARNGRVAALRAFVRKEARHILRDRQTLAILLLLPIAQLVLFGFAVRTDIQSVRLAFIAPAPDVASNELYTRFRNNGRFEIVATPRRVEELDELFRKGAADVAVIVEPGLAARLEDGSRGHIQVVADASDPNSGTAMQNYAASVVADWQDEVGATPPGIRLEMPMRMRYNPTLQSANLFVPGLIALILTLTTSLMTAISLSREKERGTFEVLLVSPLRPWQIIVGKVVPYLLLAFANVVTVLLAAWLVFDVPFRGSVSLLLGASTLFALVGLALGVLIAAVTNSQLAAMLAALGGTMLPNIMLSGMIFPITSMPRVLQLVSQIVPARWFIEICRGITLKGAGFAALRQDLLILLAMFILLMVVAIRKTAVRLA